MAWGVLVNIGATSVLQAELIGVKEGLRLARSLNVSRLSVGVDSSLAVLLLSSDSCSTFHVLGNLLQDCRGLLREFDHVLVRHVLRGGNKCADYLASLAQSSSHGLTLLEEPPAALGPLLQADRLGIESLRL
ncbi:hypothetical protein CCACVL1_00811 [Corchorus capsularis]|uniref:RNase H type-1 domain-containing protein n=1 Tax=Corchorus capsularis TaxID=210143 RepID=A0A1R3KUH3_COCAP|nr:hypothetical protein CCACVL1_00811 [Corchorus capsularis]